MSRTQLDYLVYQFRRTKDERYFNIIYNQIFPLINRASEEIAYYVNDTEYFEKRVDERLEQAVFDFDDSNGSFYSFAKAIVEREKAYFLKQYARLKMTSLEQLDDMYAEQGGFQLRSEGPSVESIVITDDKITSLAQGDQRKTMILFFWSQGETDSEISRVLAHRFGGSSEYQRLYVKRYRKKLREQMHSLLA